MLSRASASPILAILLLAASATAQQPALIPESEISALEKALQEGISGGGRTGVAHRRALKNTARKGLALVEEYPGAENRFRVLGMVVQCQKRMLAMAGNEKNREALFATCEQLVDAPDSYARERLEADLMLSDRDLSAKNATLEERSQALAELLERYRGTVAEARSLLTAALIVQQLDNRELESQILYALDERFSDDHEVIEFRRKFLKISRLDLVFNGKHKRVDGTEIVFPNDSFGHMSLMIFWSKHKPGADKYLEDTKSVLTNYPGLIDVYSFNLDGLPDGGASVLKEHGLDWMVMRLPGGRNSQAYRSYAQGDPMAVLVNEYGLAVTRPEIVHGRSAAVDGTRISDDRYQAQLQSIFTGDFLVTEPFSMPGQPPTDPAAAKFEAIKKCFTMVPFRYRLKRDEAIAEYGEADKLCGELIGNGAPADVWRIRDHRIIALLGLWNLACEPKYLEAAIREAKLTASAGLSAEATVISRFCLAKAALRDQNARGAHVPPAVCIHGKDGAGTPCTVCGPGQDVVKAFVDACGGDDAPAGAIACATILAVEARDRESYDAYRDRFLESHAENPQFYAFTSFLRDRHIQYRVLKANHTLRERRARGYIVGHGYPWPTNFLPAITLKKVGGGNLSLPKDTNGKLTYLMFVEPPAGGGTNNWTIQRDSRGNIRGASGVHTVMKYANDLTKSHVHKEINFVAAFLTDDAEHVKYLVKTNGWDCQAVMVPGGLQNPMVRRLGIFSADRFPNVFLLRRDGSIAWKASGFRYKNEFGFPFANLLGMKVHVEVCDAERGYEALARGDYKEAARMFSGPFLRAEPDRFGWRSPRYHGKALALAGLKDWNGAIEAIDEALLSHKRRHYRGRGPRHGQTWATILTGLKLKAPCDVMTGLWATKAWMLEKAGRKDDAAEVRKLAEQPAAEEYSHIYKLFHERLHTLMETKK